MLSYFPTAPTQPAYGRTVFRTTSKAVRSSDSGTGYRTVYMTSSQSHRLDAPQRSRSAGGLVGFLFAQNIAFLI